MSPGVPAAEIYQREDASVLSVAWNLQLPKIGEVHEVRVPWENPIKAFFNELDRSELISLANGTISKKGF